MMVELRPVTGAFITLCEEWFNDPRFQADDMALAGWTGNEVVRYFVNFPGIVRAVWLGETPVGFVALDRIDRYHGTASLLARSRRDGNFGVPLLRAIIVFVDAAFRELDLAKVRIQRVRPFHREEALWRFEWRETGAMRGPDGERRDLLHYGATREQFYGSPVVRRMLHGRSLVAS